MICYFAGLDKMKVCCRWESKVFVMAVLCLCLKADRMYQCRFGNVVGHSINVILKGDIVNDTFQDQNETSTDSPYTDDKQMWLYLYTTVGIVGFVIVVTVISVLAIRGCNGKTKNKAQSENQYADIPMVEHHSSHQTLPRASPERLHLTAPAGKRRPPLLLSSEQTNRRPQAQERSTRGGKFCRLAALNHEHLATASPRLRLEAEERSEYAAIKVS
ncbi:hypothetical protein WMY93_022455 [Mugilogobius chulae]|uniref:Uncharacterized protein n=1 Tax=Mugilogobius chulae TaxID=88201 RepID=A0AAW0N8J8_9GOBI